MNINKDSMVQILANNVLTITYKKQNGDIRQIDCTKCLRLLQSENGYEILKYKNPKGICQVPVSLLSIWDLGDKSYKRIYIDNIISIDNVIPAEKFQNKLDNAVEGIKFIKQFVGI